MQKEELEVYKNSKIKINLKDNTFFSGYIQNLNDDSLLLKDKYNALVTISYSDISFIIQIGGCFQ